MLGLHLHTDSVAKEKGRRTLHFRVLTQKNLQHTKMIVYTKTLMSRQGLILRSQWRMQRMKEHKAMREKGELRLGAWIISINAVIYHYLVFKFRCLSTCFLGLSLLIFFSLFFSISDWRTTYWLWNTHHVLKTRNL